MLPIEAYGGSDFRSIEADNTSSFNCRSATGSSSWSEHAYGRAIDLDPIENPYVATDGTTSHAASRPYLDRARGAHAAGRDRRGRRGRCAPSRASAGAGAGAGAVPRDYQHLSASGR